jgi:hypothetical protein
MESSAALGAPGAVGARLRATASLLQPKSSPASPVRAGLEQCRSAIIRVGMRAMYERVWSPASGLLRGWRLVLMALPSATTLWS